MALTQAVAEEIETLPPFPGTARRDRLTSSDDSQPAPALTRGATGDGGLTYMTAHNPLERLIRQRAAELNETVVDIAKRGGMSNSTVYSLINRVEHRQPPRPATLKKLAKGLQLPLDVVRVAAAEAAGFHLEEMTGSLSGHETLKVIVAAHEKLSEADRRKLMRLAEAFVEESRAAAGVEAPTRKRGRK